MNKTIKMLSAVTIIIMLCFTCTTVLAGGSTGTSGSGAISPDLIPEPKAEGETAGKISDMGASIAGIIQVVGMSIAVIILIYIGIKYILGSAEEQAQYKKSMIPYIVGAVLLFIASFLVRVIYDFTLNLKQM